MNAHGPLPREDLEFVEKGAAALWPQLAGARIFVTGATGFFGKWILESLFSANERHGLGVRVLALSRSPEAFVEANPHMEREGLRWMTGSVETLEPADLSGEALDFVIHLATEADLKAAAADPSAAAGVITGGTRRVLEAARRAGARRLLFTSSGAVYGPQPAATEYVGEGYPGLPNSGNGASPYGATGEAKRQAELLCAAHGSGDGLGAVIARCFTFAGPGLPLRDKFAFGNFMADALGGGPIIIKGDGSSVRSYMYAADLAVWLWTLLLKGAPGRAYNVGSEQAVSVRRLAESIGAVLGSHGIEMLQTPKPGAVPDRYVPSTLRAREELGLSEHFSLTDTIRRTAVWLRSEVKH